MRIEGNAQIAKEFRYPVAIPWLCFIVYAASGVMGVPARHLPIKDAHSHGNEHPAVSPAASNEDRQVVIGVDAVGIGRRNESGNYVLWGEVGAAVIAVTAINHVDAVAADESIRAVIVGNHIAGMTS